MSYIPVSSEPRPLGGSGIMVSPIAWGMWRFAGDDVAAAQRLIEAAFGAGVTLFDTADIYGFDGERGFGDAETLLGRVFAATSALRGRMVLATKGGIRPPAPYDQSADYLAGAIDASLRRLRTERVELWQIHRPDILTHPAEIARTLEDAHAAGKIGAVGVSNFTVAQTRALAAHLPLPIVSHQPEYSPLHLAPLTEGILDQAIEQDMAVLAWSPLGGGRIADPQTPRALAVAAALDAKAQEAGVSRAIAAYSWIMAHPARPIPIAGTQNAARIAELGDVFKPRWTRRDWYAVLEASLGETLP